MIAVPSVRVGAPVTHDKLTVFPLYLDAPAAPNYRLSEEALVDGSRASLGEAGCFLPMPRDSQNVVGRAINKHG